MKFLAAILAVLAAAGTIDPGCSDRKHLEYGSQFHCVLKISGRDKESNREAWASCVAISPRWIVTAAHVVTECDDWSVSVSGTTVKVVRVLIHDDFEDGHDIAIGKTESDLGLDFYPALYGHQDEAGKLASICGYGITGTFRTGGVLSDGLRRAGSNFVDEVDSRGLLICSVGKGERTSLEYCIAPGDSGGGLFIDGKLAGINSVVIAKGRSPKSTYGEESGHTRISTHREWINDNAK